MYYSKISAVYFTYFCFLGVFFSFWPVFFIENTGESIAAVGFLSAVINSVRIFFPMLWSSYSDLKGIPLSILRFGALMSFIAMLGMHYQASFLWYAIILSIFMVFWSSILPQSDVLALTYLKGKEQNYGRIRLWGSIGFIVGAISFGVIVKHGGLNYLLYILNAILFLLILATMSLKQVGNSKRKHGTSKKLFSFVRIKFYLKQRYIWSFMLVITLFQISFVPYYIFFTISLIELGYEADFIGMLWGLGILSEVIIFALSPQIFKIFGSHIPRLISFSIATGCLRWILLCFYADNFPILILIQMLHAFSFGCFHIATVEHIRKLFAAKDLSKGQALASHVFRSLGDVLGGIFSGIMWLYLGQYIYLVAAFISIITLAIFQYGRNTIR